MEFSQKESPGLMKLKAREKPLPAAHMSHTQKKLTQGEEQNRTEQNGIVE
jgi:hypothetical protein